MLLNYDEIQEQINQGELNINPFKIENLGPNSYDLTINEKIQLLHQGGTSECGFFCPTDPDKNPGYEGRLLPHFLYPGDAIRCSTKEVVTFKSKTYGIIFTRSNLSRFPIYINHGPLVDTGYSGVLSFVITNNSHNLIRIEPNMRVLQLLFYTCNPMSVKYFDRKNSKNKGQISGTVPGFNVDKEFKNEKNI